MTISQAASVNLWREAILDRLAALCMDAPQDEPPASILRRIIAAEVEIALDPSVSDAVPRRTLLQQALDALDAITDDVDGTGLNTMPSFDKAIDAITALREALAAPEPEPVALESVHLTRDTRGMCVVRVNGRVAIRDNGDIIDHMATLEWFAAPPAAPAPAVPLQGGLDNNELLAAWQKKLPGKVPEGQELNAFAVGTEVGFEHAQRLERMDWDRVHHVLAKHGKHPGRTDDHLADVIDKALSAAPAEDFCYCDDDISLQMVSGGAALEGLYGRVTLKIGDAYVNYVKAQPAPVPLTDTETHAELWKLAVRKGLVTVRSELIDPRNHGTRVSWMQGHDKACDISNDAAAHGIAASPEQPK